MKERPILFSDTMVRAILAGTKTQTRRVVMHNRAPARGAFWDHAGYNPSIDADGAIRFRVGGPGGEEAHGSPEVPCPYGVPGDRLWVRETWRVVSAAEGDVGYRATESSARFLSEGDRAWWKRWEGHSWGKRGACWVPSIYMPRWASRLSLEITSVRVERVQSISELDARAEGVTPAEIGDVTCWRAFRVLWDSINGERPGCAWRDNPWVWALTFEVRG